jgi:hypothetical protein
MLLPYETWSTVYYVALPKYEWLPVPESPVPEQIEALPSVPPPPETIDPHRPMQLVFTGVEWHGFRLYYLRENPAWESLNSLERDEAEKRIIEQAHRIKPPSSIGTAPSAESPHSSVGDPAAKLDGERT